MTVTTASSPAGRASTQRKRLVADHFRRLWLIVGTDSGFEATTSLWYTRIDVRLVPQEVTTLR